MSTPSTGVVRCASCGASDVTPDGDWLACSFCRHRWMPATDDAPWRRSDGIASLTGTTVSDGAEPGTRATLISIECDGCGATVGINTAAQLSARCHWCRHTLSLNSPINNGAVPDAILPFAITREDAQARMSQYVKDRATYATAHFKADFARHEVYPVYLPYLVVDGNVTVRLDGRARVITDRQAFDNANLYRWDDYQVMREADLAVDDLVIEARSTHSHLYSAVSTTNIINAIQPFDLANAVPFDARYIGEGVSFERRDTDVDRAMDLAAEHMATIARGYVQDDMSDYQGGTRWEAEQVAIKGTRWFAVLLPVWLYGYEEATPNGPLMHYVAVNGRSGEVEGSVPTDQGRAKRAGWKTGLTIAACAIPFFVADWWTFVGQFMGLDR